MENNLRIGDYINVQAYKHNGVLYRQWNGIKVLDITDDFVILFVKKTKVAQKTGKKWTFNDTGLWFFSRKELFNCIITIKANGWYNYINIASKFIFEDNTIKYVDYDLDIKVYPQDSLRIVDRNEFTENRKKYKYPDSLVKNLYKQLEKLVNYYYNSEGVFNEDFVNKKLSDARDDKLLINVALFRRRGSRKE
ncbi:Protein of uncharacterised function (DUF402) [Mycoplasmopsis californica]|uniref:DUF402 domain-containing protein n=1 Tax=Mycoplasmopsis equigenitalium TaxID=114883 RepID=A0ABY5J0J3_9BACT|nr:DUF402 domain-containing protein [Mycoplasmopsis equigenitalium]UUD36778.1 DUF402 domain-containing protein [Mycoplasmopsis equigenitalium]VEU69923.1 Protein of uncharacterised function (DUF402) [Mycoplasmopsis californica]